MSTTPPVVPAPAPAKVSWLKRLGQVLATAAKDVVSFLGSSKVQTAEAQIANVAELLLPAEAPLIQEFQAIMGKIFQQAVVTESVAANITGSGKQKLDAVVAGIGPELNQWVANNFPGSKTISADVQKGLVNAIVALQNDITAPPASPAVKS